MRIRRPEQEFQLAKAGGCVKAQLTDVQLFHKDIGKCLQWVPYLHPLQEIYTTYGLSSVTMRTCVNGTRMISLSPYP